jgi:hypothetical protein
MTGAIPEYFWMLAASGAGSDFHPQRTLYVDEREIPLRSLSSKEWIAGLRYRKSVLFHPFTRKSAFSFRYHSG